jgi:hypothetical protein
MVIDHADSLHESVTDSRAHELEAFLFQRFAHGI